MPILIKINRIVETKEEVVPEIEHIMQMIQNGDTAGVDWSITDAGEIPEGEFVDEEEDAKNPDEEFDNHNENTVEENNEEEDW